MGRLPKWVRIAGLVGLCLGVGVLFGKEAVSQSGTDQYRVELVMTDQYRVAKALNQMSTQGWEYVSSIQRLDGRALLVFRRAR